MFVFFALYLPLFLYCITTCIFHIYKSFKDEKIYRNINIGSAIAFGIHGGFYTNCFHCNKKFINNIIIAIE